MTPGNAPLTDSQVKERMNGMDTIVAQASRRFFRGRARTGDGVPIDYKTPLDELAEIEERAEAELKAQFAEDDARAMESAFKAFVDYEAEFINWLFAAGPHPLEVIRRLFAYAKMRDPRLLHNMGFRQIGPLLGETHGAAQWRCRALFGGMPAGWKKGTQAVESMRRAQRGNTNRKLSANKAKRALAD